MRNGYLTKQDMLAMVLNQRLDTPFIKYNGKFEKASWEEVFKIIKSKIENTSKDKIAGFVGDLSNMESSYIFKEFFDRTLDSSNYESRSSNYYVDNSERENYIFNSSIKGIEDAGLIFLIGANPRFEATILNARIRKSFLNNNTKIISLNDVGDLTYSYEKLDGQTKTIVDIFQGRNDLSKKIISTKKPLIILGESFFKIESAKYIFDLIKNYLKKNNKISSEWNSLNKLTSDAATVGSLDLNIINHNENMFDGLNNHKYEIIYLLGQDDLKFSKKDEFIIYQGSHGDKGAKLQI